jgi:hypothetical protein
MKHNRRAVTVAVGALAAASVVSGCWHSHGDDDESQTQTALCQTANLDPSVPIDTAQDWATYADHLTVVHVVSEHEGRRDRDDGDPSTGYLGRKVTVHVDDVLWSRREAPAMPHEMTWSAAGWSFDSDHQEKAYWWGFPRLEVGHSYVLPVTDWSRPGANHRADWEPYTTTGILPYDDGVLGDGETTPCRHPDWAPVAKQAVGKDAQALAAILERSKPDPEAVPYLDLDPRTRFERASRHR